MEKESIQIVLNHLYTERSSLEEALSTVRRDIAKLEVIMASDKPFQLVAAQLGSETIPVQQAPVAVLGDTLSKERMRYEEYKQHIVSALQQSPLPLSTIELWEVLRTTIPFLKPGHLQAPLKKMEAEGCIRQIEVKQRRSQRGKPIYYELVLLSG